MTGPTCQVCRIRPATLKGIGPGGSPIFFVCDHCNKPSQLRGKRLAYKAIIVSRETPKQG